MTPVDAADITRTRSLILRLSEETARLQVEQAQLRREAPWRWLRAVVTFVCAKLLVVTFI